MRLYSNRYLVGRPPECDDDSRLRRAFDAWQPSDRDRRITPLRLFCAFPAIRPLNRSTIWIRQQSTKEPTWEPSSELSTSSTSPMLVLRAKALGGTWIVLITSRIGSGRVWRRPGIR